MDEEQKRKINEFLDKKAKELEDLGVDRTKAIIFVGTIIFEGLSLVASKQEEAKENERL